jgi:hypothetical protein
MQHSVAIEAPNAQSAVLLPLAGMSEFANLCLLHTHYRKYVLRKSAFAAFNWTKNDL